METRIGLEIRLPFTGISGLKDRTNKSLLKEELSEFRQSNPDFIKTSDESTQSVLDVLCSMIREGELFVPHDQSKDQTLITTESNVWTV